MLAVTITGEATKQAWPASGAAHVVVLEGEAWVRNHGQSEIDGCAYHSTITGAVGEPATASPGGRETKRSCRQV
jgi:hypothetical protein